MNDLYKDIVLDHSANPRNFRVIPDSTHKISANNPICGDKVEIMLKIQNSKLEDMAFQGSGCALSIASASIMSGLVKDLELEKVDPLVSFVQAVCTGSKTFAIPEGMEKTYAKLTVFNGVKEFPIRIKCVTMCWHALKGAINSPS